HTLSSTLFPYTTRFRSKHARRTDLGNVFQTERDHFHFALIVRAGRKQNIRVWINLLVQRQQNVDCKLSVLFLDNLFDINQNAPVDRKSTRLNSSHVSTS